MSGGVDSAVALLRAGPNAIGVTLRLWLDPEGPDAERACCSPEAVLAARRDLPCARPPARHARPARGLPPRGRDAVRARLRAAARRRTRASRCNGGFRFAELLAFARRAGAARLATGHYARIVEHRGRLLLARARRRRQGSVLHARHARSRRCSTASGSRSASRRRTETRAEAAARRARGRTARREPGGLLPGRGRLPRLPRAPRARRRAGRRSSTRAGAELGRHDGYWRFTPGQRRGLGVAAAEPLYALRTEPARTPSSSARARRSARDEVWRRRAPLHSGRRAARSSSATARPRSARTSRRPSRGSGCGSTRRRSASRRGRPRSSTTATPSSARGSMRRDP